MTDGPHPFNDLQIPEEHPDTRIDDQPTHRNPRNRVFGAIMPDGSLAYETIKTNPSKAFRAMKRTGVLARGGVLWEFVLSRKKTDVSSIARQSLKNETYIGPMR